MMPPTSIDGTDITGATIDGTDVQEITVDGQSVFTAVPPSPGFVAENNLVAYYELQTNTNDLTAGAAWAADPTDYSLTNNGGDFSGTFQNGDSCARLDSSENFSNTQVASAQIPSTSSPFTTACWINCLTTNNNGDAFFISSDDDNSFSAIRVSGFGADWDIGTHDEAFLLQSPFPGTNIWAHLCAVYTGSEMRLFVNGQREDAALSSGWENSKYKVNNLNGKLTSSFYYDLRLYNTALSDTQINQIFQNTQ
jgi:hypothetical protein